MKYDRLALLFLVRQQKPLSRINHIPIQKNEILFIHLITFAQRIDRFPRIYRNYSIFANGQNQYFSLNRGTQQPVQPNHRQNRKISVLANFIQIITPLYPE